MGEVFGKKMTCNRDKNSILLHVGLWGGSFENDLQSRQALYEREGFALRTTIAYRAGGGV